MKKLEHGLELIGDGILAEEVPQSVIFWTTEGDEVELHAVWKGKERVLYVSSNDSPQKARIIDFCKRNGCGKGLKVKPVENIEGVQI